MNKDIFQLKAFIDPQDDTWVCPSCTAEKPDNNYIQETYEFNPATDSFHSLCSVCNLPLNEC